ncbi:MAG: hypothetical protein RLZZ522_241 [Verrucomicrobiota bacterium]|jgi:hypothetical protein
MPILMRATDVVLIFAGVFLTALSAAETAAPLTQESPAASVSLSDAALEQLLSERGSPVALQAAIERARKHGVSEQAILEARFLFQVDRQDDAAIAAMLPEFSKRNEGFKLEESKIFATREDWLATYEYVQALAALKKRDKAAFKQHITEAFWLSPGQGAAFAPHIDRLRLEEAMSAVKIDFTAEFGIMNSTATQSLKKILGDNHALLLHFWSPWSDEGESGMADFALTAKTLAAHHIAVASLLPEDSEKLLRDAVVSIKKIPPPAPGAWLVDRWQQSLHRVLRVQAFPTMVLVATDGTILFNGDPAADGLWAALQKVNPEIHRPALAETLGQP